MARKKKPVARSSASVTHTQLVADVAAAAGRTKVAAREALKALATTLHKHVRAGHKVRLNAVGTFRLRHFKARNGVNPQTQKAMKIAASRSPGFKASKLFKEKL